jgi:hypothetical protein
MVLIWLRCSKLRLARYRAFDRCRLRVGPSLELDQGKRGGLVLPGTFLSERRRN